MMEMVTAIALGCFLVAYIFSFLIQSLPILKRISESYAIGNIVENKMELLRSLPYSELHNCYRVSFEVPEENLEELKNSTPGLTIQNYQGDEKIKKIEVSFKWQVPAGIWKEVKSVTLISQKE